MLGFFYIPIRFILSSTFQATSSILLAALAASFRVGLLYGIIRIATAPAAALMPAVIAHPFTLTFITPFCVSMPLSKKFTYGKISAFSRRKNCDIMTKNGIGEVLMSIDMLQEKIRKTKNPSMVDLYYFMHLEIFD